jgi:hypothetical protein
VQQERPKPVQLVLQPQALLEQPLVLPQLA